eukprot:349964-Chlamydomonas_euryale.AAC.2
MLRARRCAAAPGLRRSARPATTSARGSRALSVPHASRAVPAARVRRAARCQAAAGHQGRCARRGISSATSLVSNASVRIRTAIAKRAGAAAGGAADATRERSAVVLGATQRKKRAARAAEGHLRVMLACRAAGQGLIIRTGCPCRRPLMQFHTRQSLSLFQHTPRPEPAHVHVSMQRG